MQQTELGQKLGLLHCFFVGNSPLIQEQSLCVGLRMPGKGSQGASSCLAELTWEALAHSLPRRLYTL